jgi:hypothetical protein
MVSFIEFAIRRGGRRARRYRPEPLRPALSHERIWRDLAGGTGYNPHQPMLKVLRVSSVLLVCVAAYAVSATGKWDTQTFELARKIVAITGPGPASLNFQNSSSLTADVAAGIRHSMESDLRASGVQLRDGAPVNLRVILSENIRGYVWLAQVQQGAETKVAMLAFPKQDASSASSSTVVLRRSFLIAQQEQILDAAIWQSHDQRFLLVLGPSQVNIFKQNGSRWDSVTVVGIPHETYPRDLRGRLWVGKDGDWKAFLPGIQCSGAQQLQQPMTCRDSDDPWALSGTTTAFYNSARNYFTGAMVPEPAKAFPPFYSAAQVKVANVDGWVLAGIDGQTMIFDGSAIRGLAGTGDFGSDIASVHSGCGSGTQLLATAAGDDSANDTIRAFEIDDQGARAVSPPLAFDGPLTALWTTPDGDSAIAVLRTQTESYEAYSVSVACNQ